MEGYERNWRGCIENDWIENKTLFTFLLLNIVLYRVNTLMFILLNMNMMCT